MGERLPGSLAWAALKPGVSSGLDREQFMFVSRFLTGRSDLNDEVGAKILQSLSEDMEHKKALMILFKELKKSKPQRLGFGPVTVEGADRTIREVLSSWYLGYRIHNDKPTLFTYYDALMFKATAGIRNIPSTCGGELGFWSLPPKV